MHPFANYIRILARGQKGSRDLTQDEAHAAFKMILANEVRPEQLGAFLMLMRVKEETPAELSGFVGAAKSSIAQPLQAITIDLDWSSYAGKRRHLPWFFLSALLLAEKGVKTLMHGLRGRKDDRIYTPNILHYFHMHSASSLDEAAKQIGTDNIAFIELENLSPKLAELIDLREIFGLRSPVHSLSRLLNPLNAPCVMQGIFHPGYKAIHRDAALLLGITRATILKGEGGEIELNPDIDNEIFSVCAGSAGTEIWPSLFGGRRHLKDEAMNPAKLVHVWRGEAEDEYGVAAVILTAAVALKLLQKASTQEEALQLAHNWWDARAKDKF